MYYLKMTNFGRMYLIFVSNLENTLNYFIFVLTYFDKITINVKRLVNGESFLEMYCAHVNDN